MTTNFSKIDLHVHSKYSKDAGDWFLSSLGIQESYSTPEQVYKTAIQRGMDFVTLTDHDSIEGALQLAHLDNFITGEEVTTFFPKDGAKVHVVVLGITEEQHNEIQYHRYNIYDLTNYLNTNEIFHFVAHPFFKMTTLSENHFEQMVVLFKTFEVKNGGKQLYPDDLLERILNSLNPERIWELAEKYNIEPTGKDPWIKYKVAGSDDHGGILLGWPHTMVPQASDKSVLINHLKEGLCHPFGTGGTPLSVAHSIFAVALQFQKSKREHQSGMTFDLINNMFVSILSGNSLSFQTRMALFFLEKLPFGFLTNNPHIKNSLIYGLIDQLKNNKVRQIFNQALQFDYNDNEKLFDLFNEYLKSVVQKLSDNLDSGSDSYLNCIKEIGIVTAISMPYLIAFKLEYKDRKLMDSIRNSFLVTGKEDIAIFGDYESNRMKKSKIIAKNIHLLNRNARYIYFGVNTSGNIQDFDIIFEKNISMFNTFVRIPSILRVFHKLSKCNATKIYIHSFGPMGLTGLFTAKWLGIPVICRFSNNDFNKIYATVDDDKQHQIILSYLKYLFHQFDRIIINSESDAQKLKGMGIQENKLLFSSKQVSV